MPGKRRKLGKNRLLFQNAGLVQDSDDEVEEESNLRQTISSSSMIDRGSRNHRRSVLSQGNEDLHIDELLQSLPNDFGEGYVHLWFFSY